MGLWIGEHGEERRRRGEEEENKKIREEEEAEQTQIRGHLLQYCRQYRLIHM